MERLFDMLDLYRGEYSSNENVFSTIEGGSWRAYTARDYVSYSDRISLGLLAMGVTPGTKVATVMVNCPEWNFFDMGIMQIGAIQVPVYPTISEENYRYIFMDASIEYLIISGHPVYDRVKKIIKDFPGLKGVFSVDKIKGVRNWKEILAKADQHPEPEILEDLKASIGKDDLVTIIYTSGTTGRPKGVMLSHNNFISNLLALSKIPPINRYDRVISFLPLCHVYERIACYCYQFKGATVYYLQNIEELSEALPEVRPHAFVTVPRVLEKMYASVTIRGRCLPMLRRALFFWGIRQGHKFDFDKQKKNWLYSIKLRLAYLLVLSRINESMGGCIKFIVCGSASLHPRLSSFFWASKMPVLEGYGLTETSPGISMFRCNPEGVRFGTVGQLLENVKVRFAEDGEILVKSPGVMLGYYNRPERTAETIDKDGWLHTGDIGEMEEGDFLKITDRKKEIFKTSGGKYVAPQVIEQRIKESPFIEFVMVTGENRKCTGALIVPNFQHLRAWCEVKRIHFISNEKAISNPQIIRRFQREIDRYNADLGQTEKIKRFILLPYEWSVATGEFSPTLKLRRKFILEKYADLIEEMYAGAEIHPGKKANAVS